MSDFFGQVADIMNAGRDTAVAVDNLLSFGGGRLSGVELEQARARMNRLNGSGAPDSSGAVSDARRRTGILGAISGDAPMPSWGIAVAIGAVVLVGLYVVRKLR